ncbi:MAG: hypothetical protein QXP81_11250, partial [Nitrososphaerota archaeon]
MRIGFSGSREGMTERQRRALRALLERFYEPDSEFHHGDCVGADEEAGAIAFGIGYRVVIHPPENPALRAFSALFHELLEPKPYLGRNEEIVRSVDLLIAAPRRIDDRRGG